MANLKIDEKWSIEYDPDNNDRPVRILRFEEPAISTGHWKNPEHAMFYALLSAHAEIERLRGKLAEAQEYLGLLIPHASQMDNEAPEWLHSGEVDPVFVNVPRAILRAAAEWMEAGR